jgi:hypothetical protein
MLFPSRLGVPPTAVRRNPASVWQGTGAAGRRPRICRFGVVAHLQTVSLKYFAAVKARGCLVAVAAVLLALVGASGAVARVAPHRRHTEVRRPAAAGQVGLGKHGGFNMAINFKEPGLAVLDVGSVNFKTLNVSSTEYGAHFHGSLVGGTVRARFGPIGSIALRFKPAGKPHLGRRPKGCSGARPRSERGSFVGTISLLGEGGYFHVSTHAASGTLERSFRLTCRVRRAQATVPTESLREALQALREFALGPFGTSDASLLAGGQEGGREVLVRAAHSAGGGAGAELSALAFEYQGKMPVSRVAWAPTAPAGTLLTSLPGEHPATATVKSTGPFSGEARYVGASRLSHEWTGDLTAHFPGLVQPLTGPHIYSSLCVVSPLIDAKGCDAVPPDWKGPEVSPAADSADLPGSRG